MQMAIDSRNKSESKSAVKSMLRSAMLKCHTGEGESMAMHQKPPQVDFRAVNWTQIATGHRERKKLWKTLCRFNPKYRYHRCLSESSRCSYESCYHEPRQRWLISVSATASAVTLSSRATAAHIPSCGLQMPGLGLRSLSPSLSRLLSHTGKCSTICIY